MAILFNRVAGDSQYGTAEVLVPVHLLDESLGVVRLRLRELPAGLSQELHDRRLAGDDDALLELVRWGVAGHDVNDFLEDTPDGQVPIPYQSETAEYHGRSWRVAHHDTLSMYQRALPKSLFLHSIAACLAWYQGGVIPTARQIWDSAKPKKEAPPLDERPAPQAITAL